MQGGAGKRWWDGRVGYEVYLPSFADGSGDGLGDLSGVRDRLDHLQRLGVDLLWLTPFYVSPLRDQGYDIADHCAVDPRYGDLSEFDALLQDAHARGMRVLVDLVVNHTSDQHRWFLQSRSSRENEHRDHYLWRDPADDGGPPNNWVSYFGGPAWTLDPATGQYYLHLFLPEQPDLNWRNPAVQAEIDQVLVFWLDRGVDGFRIDTAHMFVKHPDLPDNPPATGPAGSVVGAAASWLSQQHRYDVDQPDVLDVHRRFRAVVEPYGALLIGEVYLLDAAAVARYVDSQDGLHASFLFTTVGLRWDPDRLGAELRRATARSPHLAWVLSSHDSRRAVSCFGGGQLGQQRALLVHTLLFGLPGLPFLFQGEELGLEDGRVLPGQARDPISAVTGEHAAGRDAARTPMPWSPEPGWGFTTPTATPWLTFGQRSPDDTAAVQEHDPASPLHSYRRLLAARHALNSAGAATGPVRWLDPAPAGVLAYRRDALLVAANTGDEPCVVRLPPAPTSTGQWSQLFSTLSAAGPNQLSPLAQHDQLQLAAREAVILLCSP